MKNSIKLTALLVLMSAGVYAASPVKGIPPAKAEISFSAMPADRGINVKINNDKVEKAVVMVYDANGKVIFKNSMPKNKAMERGYVLNQLDNGDYTIEVAAGKQSVKKYVHVFDRDQKKVFLIRQ